MFIGYHNQLTQKSLKSVDNKLVSDHGTTLPSKFAILHMVGGVVNSTKTTCFYRNIDRIHQPSNGHIMHEAVQLPCSVT